jgi:pectin methylesterase-like acyl-CoA thioesterase
VTPSRTYTYAPRNHCTPPPAGHFFERVHVYSNFSRGVVVVGDGPTAPGALLPGLANFIEYNVSGSSGPGTFGSWTVKVDAPNVTFVNVAVANSADGYNHTTAGQSVALHLTADTFACWGCSLLGGQDTLYTGEADCRSYFTGAFINGSCDALFGGSSTVFASSRIDMSFTVTAHRGNGSTAYLVVDSEVTSPSTVLLGRPWGEQARVVFKSCYLRGVERQGWDDWGHNCTAGHAPWCNTTFFAEVRAPRRASRARVMVTGAPRSTIQRARPARTVPLTPHRSVFLPSILLFVPTQYNSTGPGADPRGRPWWTHQLTPAEAEQWTAASVLGSWTPTLPDAARAAWRPAL